MSKYGFLKIYNNCKIIETPSVYVATAKNGGTIGQSKTIAGIENIIDEYNKQLNNNI